MRNFNKNLLTVLCLLVYLNCSGSNKTEINILYLYDVSGSFYKNYLNESVDLSIRIFNKLIGPNGVPLNPQTHQVSTIDAMSVSTGGNCFTRIEKENIFDEKESDPSDEFKKCLKKILNTKPSNATDLRGALATASKTLQNEELRGKGVIIFSDLHESMKDKKDYPINLENVCVYVIYEWADYQINNPDLIKEEFFQED